MSAKGRRPKRLPVDVYTVADKVAGFDVLINSTGLVNLNAAAKIIGAGVRALYAFLRDQKVITRQGSVHVPYQKHIDAGRLRAKVRTVSRNGRTVLTGRIRVTPKGLIWLEKLWRTHQEEAVAKAKSVLARPRVEGEEECDE